METTLTAKDVHLWIAFPDKIRDPDLLAAYRDMMTEEEQRKQGSFHFPRHRHQYLVTRALARTTLSRYTGMPPGQWRFCFNRFGRPEIESPTGLAPLRFNLSHAEGLVVCAVTLERDIGVDVEDTYRKGIGLELVDRFFSKAEAFELRELSPSLMRNRFFEYWTLKESYIKARGMGLSIPLERFSFQTGNDLSIRVTFDPSLNDQQNTWYFWLMQITYRHKAALALHPTSYGPFQISCMELVPLAEERAFDATILCASQKETYS